MKMNDMFGLAGLFTVLAVCLCGCEPQVAAVHEGVGVTEAVATLEPTEGNEVSGTVRFTLEDDGVRVEAEVTGLTPGAHGFHVHENGDCSAPDGTSAGGHFNPTGAAHGAPHAEEHHVGDLGNLAADTSGKAVLNRTFRFLELNGTNSIVGRGLIVHADADDLSSQPTGNAGKRVACGVIEAIPIEAAGGAAY